MGLEISEDLEALDMQESLEFLFVVENEGIKEERSIQGGKGGGLAEGE